MNRYVRNTEQAQLRTDLASGTGSSGFEQELQGRAGTCSGLASRSPMRCEDRQSLGR